MNKRILPALLLAVSFTAPAAANPFTDELSRCLVRSTSNADRTVLLKWIYVAMSKHGDVQALSNVSESDAEDLSQQVANLTVTLLADRCRDSASDAMKYDGEAAFKTAFGVLGQVAMQDLMSSPSVAQYLGRLETHLDAKRLQEAFGQQ